MNVLARVETGGSFAPAQLSLIKRTVAKDCNEDEFNLFIEAARSLNLNPLRRQIYAFVYAKDKPDKRRMSIVVGIDGMRAVAARSGNYRPDEQAPRFVIDPSLKDPISNPQGIVSAEVTVWRYAHGDWHPITGVAYWEESAPLKEEWAYDQDQGKKAPTGVFKLDTSGQWGRMPRLMLAKVAEASALRRGWPEDLSNVYGEEEMDQARTIDLTPSEIVAEANTVQRLEKIRAADTLMVAWEPASPIERVPLGTFADRVCAFISECDTSEAVASFKDRNRETLKEFWAKRGTDALALKKEFEKRETALKAIEAPA